MAPKLQMAQKYAIILKNPLFLPEQKLVWVKIVDFLIMAFFRVSCNLGATPSITIDIEGHGSNFTETNFSSSSLFYYCL